MPEPFGVNRKSIELPSDVSSEIIQKTQGRMAEDDLWLTVEEII